MLLLCYIISFNVILRNIINNITKCYQNNFECEILSILLLHYNNQDGLTWDITSIKVTVCKIDVISLVRITDLPVPIFNLESEFLVPPTAIDVDDDDDELILILNGNWLQDGGAECIGRPDTTSPKKIWKIKKNNIRKKVKKLIVNFRTNL